MKKRAIILPGVVTVFVALSPAAVAVADNAHTGNAVNGGGPTGQPTQSLGSEPSAPHGLALTTNNGFNNVALNKYANPTSMGGMASGNTHVVSQYDVAAFEFSNRGP
jgi:hypothetical protein